MRYALTLTAALMLSSPVAAERIDGVRVAVLEIDGPLSIDVQLRIADEIRAGALDALGRRGAYIVSRETTVTIIDEMGASCVDATCEVSVLRTLGVDLGITGTLTRIEKQLVLTVQLLEVRTGALLETASVRDAHILGLIERTRAAVAVTLDLVDARTLERVRASARSGFESRLARDARGRTGADALWRFDEPLALVEHVPMRDAIDEACRSVIVDGSPCDSAQLASLPQVRVAVGAPPGVDVSVLLDGEVSRGCYDVFVIRVHSSSWMRMDLGQSRLLAGPEEYALRPPRSAADRAWVSARAPADVFLEGPRANDDGCFEHALRAAPLRIMIPVSTSDAASSIVVELSQTTAPISEEDALERLAPPPLSSTWPDEPSYAPSLLTAGWLLLAAAHTVGAAGLVGAYAAVSTPDDGQNRPPTGFELVVVQFMLGAFYATAAVAVAGVVTAAIEAVRFVSSRRDIARHEARVRYDARRASLGMLADVDE